MEGQMRALRWRNSMTPDNPEMVAVLRKAKEFGFSDRQLAETRGGSPKATSVPLHAAKSGTVPTY